MGLSACPEIGARRFRALLSAFGSASAVWSASEAQLRAQAGLSASVATKLVQHCRHTDPAALFAQIRTQGIGLCFPEDAHYPAALNTLHDPPFLLYWRGSPQAWERFGRALALVGTRQPTPAGLEIARSLARELSYQGVTSVSGLASGIDTAVHQGALEAGGCTVAVLGMGLNHIPRAKSHLAAEIETQGLLISEYPPAFSGTKWSFPLRNRIISGLSGGVCVIEAAPGSGALITADCALEQGREVMALPGLVSAPQSAGPHALIQQGAALVTCVSDMLEVMGWEPSQAQALPSPSDDNVLTNPENEVYLILNEIPRSLESLTHQLNWPVSQTLTLLTQLELGGRVRQWPGSRYSRI